MDMHAAPSSEPFASACLLLMDSGPDLSRAAGLLHPLVVHFPIALALVAIGAEWWRSVTRQQGFSPLTRPLLWLAAISAVAASVTGWINAEHGYGGKSLETLDFHRWIGIATSVGLLGVACWCQALSGALARAFGQPSLETLAQLGAFRWAALAVGIGVGVTGHLGGELVHGSGYLTKVLFPASEPPELEPTEQSVVEQAALSPEELYFVENVRPLLETHCFECHGSRRQKGGLRMDTKAWLFNGESDEWTVLPGNSAESEFLKRVVLDRAHPDAMPPDGPGLTQDETNVLRRWIDDGAVYPERAGGGAATVGGLNSSASAQVLAVAGTLSIAGGSTVEISSEAKTRAANAARALAARGVLVQPIAIESPLLDVNASRAEPPLSDADASLLADVAPVVANLNVSRSKLTDVGLAKVGSMVHLERLRIDYTEIGDAGLVALGVLPRMESINLIGSKVTPALTEWLRQQTRLGRVYVWQTELDTPELFERLREGTKLDPIGGDVPVAQPITPPMPDEQANSDDTPERR